MDLLYCSLTICTFVLLWFETQAFIEYTDLLRRFLPNWFTEFFFLTDYQRAMQDGTKIDYLDFVAGNFSDTFRGRLITCPLCTATWVGIMLIVAYGFKVTIPSIGLGLLFYFLIRTLMNYEHGNH